MNKEKAMQELDELENRAKELRRLIDGSGFDWDFDVEKNLYVIESNSAICNLKTGNVLYIDKELTGIDWFSNRRSATKASKMCAWICLLQHLADHFNPEGWEWECGFSYCYIIYNNSKKHLDKDYHSTANTISPKFHTDVIGDVIQELNNNRQKWWHLVTDKPLEES